MFRHFFYIHNRISNQLIRKQHSSRQRRDAYKSFIIPSTCALIISLSIVGQLYKTNKTYSKEEPKLDDIEEERVFRQEEVSQHRTKAKRIWVTYQDSVYDITDFVSNHPGGLDKIILAAGGSVEPFWKIYQQHYNSKLPLEMLAKMKIGKLHPDDVAAAAKKASENSSNSNDDPYRNDPELSPILHVFQKKPINAEAPETLLTESWITPNDLWFKRNHHPIPKIKEEDYRLTIKIPTAFLSKDKQKITSSSSTSSSVTSAVTNTAISSENDKSDNASTAASGYHGIIKQYTLHDLKTKFLSHTIIATLQCGGNRRIGMNDGGVQVGNAPTLGIAWSGSAISTATFTGVRLIDVLLDAGLDVDKVESLLDELTSLNTDDGVDSTSSSSSDSSNSSSSKNAHAHIGDNKSNPSLDDDSKKLMQSLKNQKIQQFHAQFVGADEMEASVPLTKVLNKYGDVLLAYHMNGTDIPSEHGYPVRVIVPGHVGVRNVKWVNSVTVATEESKGPWQRGMAYKGFGPSVKSIEGIDVEAIPSLQEQAVTSMITYPTTGQPLIAGQINTVKGFAYSGGGRGIVRVDVSADGGHTWQTADLTEGSNQPLHRAWAWTFWETDVNIPALSTGNDSSGSGSGSSSGSRSSSNTGCSANGNTSEDNKSSSDASSATVTTDGTEMSQSSSTSNSNSSNKKSVELICKAIDASYNVQPDSVAGIWNLRGINNNAWHRKVVEIIADYDNDGGEEE